MISVCVCHTPINILRPMLRSFGGLVASPVIAIVLVPVTPASQLNVTVLLLLPVWLGVNLTLRCCSVLGEMVTG